MTQDHFDAGIRHLEIAFSETMDAKRRAVYFQHLLSIPNYLWDAGILRLADHVRFPRLPLIAEIGEACVPGEAEREETEAWSGRWIKVQTPWPERLTSLLTPPPFRAPSPEMQHLSSGPRGPLSEAEQELLWRPDFKGLLQDLEQKVQAQKEKRATTRGVSLPENMEEKREFLHHQLSWISRHDEAERVGQEFAEEKPTG